MLVVCPKSVLPVWQDELAKWLTRPLTFYVVPTGNKGLPSADILLINYDLLKVQTALRATCHRSTS